MTRNVAKSGRNMKMMKRALGFWLALAVLVAGAPVSGDELAESARNVLAGSKDTVITLRLTVKEKVSMQGADTQESESVTEATGTVIDASGLAVTSLSATDPSQMYEDMLGSRTDMDFKLEVEVSKIVMLLDGVQETEANIVLRDKDLDLAFVRPTKPLAQPAVFADLAKGGKPQQFDPLVIPRRLGKVANRAYSAVIPRVDAILEKPRMLYVLGMGSAQPGSPVFLPDGSCVGIATIRTIAGGEEQGFGMFSGMESNMAVVVLPGADVLEIAKQAPQDAPAETAPAGAPAPDAGSTPAPAAPAEAPSVVVPNQ